MTTAPSYRTSPAATRTTTQTAPQPDARAEPPIEAGGVNGDAGQLFHIEPAGRPWEPSSYGVCDVCGERTRKKGSARHAEHAIRDHVRAKHAATASSSHPA